MFEALCHINVCVPVADVAGHHHGLAVLPVDLALVAAGGGVAQPRPEHRARLTIYDQSGPGILPAHTGQSRVIMDVRGLLVGKVLVHVTISCVRLC